MSRRHYLMSIVNLEKYKEYVFNYIYHSVIPSTIDSEQVKDSGKTKLVEIQGNSEVWNSLNMHPNDMSKASQTYSNTGVGDAGYIGYNVTPNSNAAPSTILSRTVEENGTVATTTFIDNSPATGSVFTYYYFRFFGSNFDLATSRYGHKMLIVCDMKTNVSNVRAYFGTGIFTTPDINNSWKQIRQMIELTSSNRTIGIGFTGSNISCSNGNYYSVRNVRLFDITQMFPFDTPTSLDDARVKRIIEQGYIPYNSGEIKNSVVGEISSSDTNDNLIGTITLPAPLDLGGVNTAHNIFEITKTNYVFTRNVFNVDLGTLNWYYDNTTSHETMFSDVISNIKAPANTDVVNGLCAKFQPVSWDNLYSHSKSGIAVQPNGRLRVYTNDMGNNPTDFKSAISGVPLYYELATPQTITIPKKHLGCVDLGSLNWVSTTSDRWYSSTPSPAPLYSGSTSTMSNLICSKYITVKLTDSSTTNMSVSLRADGGILIKDDNGFSGKNATQIKEYFAGVYLFYETQDEVSDFTNKCKFQSGGTITTDSEVLPNVKMKLQVK